MGSKKLRKNPLDLIKYSKYFSTPKFWAVLKNFSKNMTFVKKAVVLFYCMKDPETPKLIKAVIVGCLGYLVLPADIVPDALAGIGWLDDIAVITAVSQLAESYIKPIHIEEATKKIPFIK